MKITQKRAQQVVNGLKRICRQAGEEMSEKTRKIIQDRINKKGVKQ